MISFRIMLPTFYQQQRYQHPNFERESHNIFKQQPQRNEQFKYSNTQQAQQHCQYFRPQVQTTSSRPDTYPRSSSCQNIVNGSNNISGYYAHQALSKQSRNPAQSKAQKTVCGVASTSQKEMKWPEKGSKLAITGKDPFFKFI